MVLATLELKVIIWRLVSIIIEKGPELQVWLSLLLKIPHSGGKQLPAG